MPLNRGAVGAIAFYAQELRKAREARDTEERKANEERYKEDREFQQRLLAAGIASGRLEPIIQGGRVTGAQPPAPFDPSQLAPGQTYNQRIGSGTLTSRGPTAPPPPDPSVLAQRLASLTNTIQGIEQRNKLAPGLAMAARREAYPDPTLGFGGYTENKPGFLGGLMGQQQRPQAPAIQETDTRDLIQARDAIRNRLTGVQGNALGAPSPLTAPSSAAFGGVSTDGDLASEVSDLASAITTGLIRTRADAEQVIEAAGLNPDDPAFADILNQLP